MTYEHMIVEPRGRIDWVTLNRPDQLNTLNPQLIDELNDYFEKLYRNDQVRIVVLRGAGRAFCAGLDLKAPTRNDGPRVGRSVAEGLASQRSIADIVMKMRRCPQPIISLIQGPACGGGFSLALASDIRIAGETARMNCAYIRIGLGGCDIGSSYFLPRLVGVSVASELILTGRFINAQRALAVGLVSEVVPDADLEKAVEPYLESMITVSPLGLRLSKECLNMSVDAGSIEQVIAMEDRQQILCSQSDTFGEGVAAFLEKRRPSYAD